MFALIVSMATCHAFHLTYCSPLGNVLGRKTKSGGRSASSIRLVQVMLKDLKELESGLFSVSGSSA